MITFAALKGEMLEWLKRHAWKVCIPVKGYLGFESLSLRKEIAPIRGYFHLVAIFTRLGVGKIY